MLPNNDLRMQYRQNDRVATLPNNDWTSNFAIKGLARSFLNIDRQIGR